MVLGEDLQSANGEHDRNGRVLEPRVRDRLRCPSGQVRIHHRILDNFDQRRGLRRQALEFLGDIVRDGPDRVRSVQQSAHRRHRCFDVDVHQIVLRGVDRLLAHDQPEIATDEPLGDQRCRAALR